MMRHVRALAMTALIALLVGLPSAARAARTWTVNTTADDPPPGCTPVPSSPCSIRQALAVAGAGDTISIPAAGSHYRVTLGPLAVTVPVAIAGGGGTGTVIDASGLSQVLLVSTSGTATISSLGVTGGALTGGGASAGGGGIELAAGSLSLNGVTVSGNSVSAGRGGGGIFDHSPGTLSLANSMISANTVSLSGAGTGGGGILDSGGALALSDSTISGNSVTLAGAATASQGGGGIYDGGGPSTYLNDTIAANTATINGAAVGDGGGAIFHQGSAGSLNDLTIDGNSTNAAGGGIYNAEGAYTVKNTIIANNGSGCAGPGGIVDAGFNLEGSNTCAFAMPSDLHNTDPQLGPLAGNGGPTVTQALGPGSPAIDAGSCTDAAGNPVTTDQRGLPRPQPAAGRCDIGAFEFVPASPVPDLISGSRPAVLGTTRARFSARVNPDGPATTVQFQYGLDRRYLPPGTSGTVYNHSTRAFAIGPGYGPVTVAATVSGLLPAAVYHVHVVIDNPAGTVLGPDQTFVTAPDRPPPPPVLGRFIDVMPAGGLVRVRIGTTFVPLTEPRRLPSGTELDARYGSVRVSSASARGGTQTATFGGAVFSLSQVGARANRGLTIAALHEGAFPGIPSYAGCRKGASSVLQTLHASVGGAFQVSGRYSTGSASSGRWATTDRCNGTQTTVYRGTVSVFIPAGRVTVAVRGGHTYLAGARPSRLHG